MPTLDPRIMGFLALVAGILVQLVKGLLPESCRRWIAPVLFVVLMLVGFGLAMYSGRDPVTGLFEGFLAAASAVGLYEGLSSLPVVNTMVNSSGWPRRK